MIKPEWDRTLDRLHEARRTIDRAQEQLDLALEEGRIAGALPGWLRHGEELEPPVEEPAEEGEPEIGAEPGEPKVIDP